MSDLNKLMRFSGAHFFLPYPKHILNECNAKKRIFPRYQHFFVYAITVISRSTPSVTSRVAFAICGKQTIFNRRKKKNSTTQQKLLLYSKRGKNVSKTIIKKKQVVTDDARYFELSFSME